MTQVRQAFRQKKLSITYFRLQHFSFHESKSKLHPVRFIVPFLQAQPFPDTQWGLVTQEEWKLTRCAYDSSATAHD
jgi:hypothetical protein